MHEVLGSTYDGDTKPFLSPYLLSDLDEANTSSSTETHSPVCCCRGESKHKSPQERAYSEPIPSKRLLTL